MPIDFDESDNFLIHGKAYLRTARLCLFEILYDRHSWSEDNERVPESFRPIHYYGDDLLPPIFFGIKHGIEVCIKSMLIDAQISFPITHDTVRLFKILKRHVKRTAWQTITINEWQELINKDYIEKVIDVGLSESQKIIKYFYKNEILSEKLGRPGKPDPQNELFRYPKSMSGDEYDIMELVNKINENDIKELIKKLDSVYGNLLDIGYLIGETKSQRGNPEAIFGQIINAVPPAHPNSPAPTPRA